MPGQELKVLGRAKDNSAWCACPFVVGVLIRGWAEAVVPMASF